MSGVRGMSGKTSLMNTHRGAVEPPKGPISRIRRLTREKGHDGRAISEAHRDILRRYCALVSSGRRAGPGWRRPVMAALRFLGGQADCTRSSLADYDHTRYGPFLGVSDEGSSAPAVRAAAMESPKARALGARATPLSVGVGLDAERLGGVGEVPVGPDEFADIWAESIGRLLMTTNVGSRSNVRLYRRAPIVKLPSGKTAAAVEAAKGELGLTFKPFVEAVGGARPLLVFVEFELGSKRAVKEKLAMLEKLARHVASGGIADPALHTLGLCVRIGWGQKGLDATLAAIELAQKAGFRHVGVDGVVRKEADQAISLPGLLHYLPPEMVDAVAASAKAAGIEVRPINLVDPDTVARDIWSALNTARAMGLDLGKYGLLPLTLEESDRVVEQIQRWFPDWSAAPVFYVDQGLATRGEVYTGADLTKGIQLWLDTMARHKVRVVLIDTVEKSLGLRILKTDGDSKGILDGSQIAALDAYGRERDIRVLWAGGITPEQAFEFGKLGVFGIYVTTAVSMARRVGRHYELDPAVASEKEPTRAGVLRVKTAIEAGYLAAQLATGGPGRTRAKREAIAAAIVQAGQDQAALAKLLPEAWLAWWSGRG